MEWESVKSDGGYSSSLCRHENEGTPSQSPHAHRASCFKTYIFEHLIHEPQVHELGFGTTTNLYFPDTKACTEIPHSAAHETPNEPSIFHDDRVQSLPRVGTTGRTCSVSEVFIAQ